MRVNVTSGELASLLPASERASTRATSGETTFAASLAKLSGVAAPAAGGAPAATRATSESNSQSASSKAAKPRNETYQAVEGERYEEIVSGPRNGMFINRSGNQRDGEAFVLVKRNGREFHIYGSGADREVVPVGRRNRDSSAEPASGQAPAAKPVEYRDVEGRAYDEIMSGPRNGMFINRSGNVRDGKAFVLVKRADHELHIYGSGRDRLIVRVVSPELRADADAAAPVPKSDAANRPSTAPVAGTPTGGSSVLLT